MPAWQLRDFERTNAESRNLNCTVQSEAALHVDCQPQLSLPYWPGGCNCTGGAIRSFHAVASNRTNPRDCVKSPDCSRPSSANNRHDRT